MRNRKYNRDPHWLFSRYGGQCTRCGKKITVGEKIWYYPSTHAVYCDGDGCGAQESRDFSAAVADERSYNNGY